MGSEVIESAEEFVRLRYSSIRDEYLRAATEPASIEVWLDVIDRFPDARLWVAQNKTVPTDVLSLLANDPGSKVRWMVAMKNKLTQELFEALSNDPDMTVRQRIACNKNVPPTVLAKLAQDPEELVSSAATRTLPRS